MKEDRIRANQFISLELELNSIKFKGIQLGSIMAQYLNNLFRDIYKKKKISLFFYVLFLHLKPIFRKTKIANYNKKIIFYKSGNFRHHNKIKEAIINDGYLKSNTLIIGTISENSLNKKWVTQTSTFTEIIEIWKFLRRKNKEIHNILKNYSIKNLIYTSFFWELFCQLTKVNSVIRFLKAQKETRIICSDYDRGADTAIWFAVGKYLNLKSFTIQHGVINPPYGYYPIIADEIWVWGEMSKKQLIEGGVKESSIRITGTPIIEKIKISESSKKEIKNKIGLKYGRTIILALSIPDKEIDIKLVKFFKEIQQINQNDEDNFLVKLHPSQKEVDYKWILNDFNLQILPNTINIIDFIHILDILLIHTSGLGNEVLYYNKRVGVINFNSIATGNGLELHKYCNVPLLEEPINFLTFNNKDKFIKKEFIAICVGEEANVKISKNIYESLDSR